MNQILIRSVLLDNRFSDVLIEGNVFKAIAPAGTLRTTEPDAMEIDGSHRAIVPAFYNAHTHAAMTFCRGLSDDVPLQVWLEKYIWPREAQLSAEDVYVASRFAILEKPFVVGETLSAKQEIMRHKISQLYEKEITELFK